MSGLVGDVGARSGIVGIPSGRIIDSGVNVYTSGSHSTTSITYEAVCNYVEISCTVGNTILFYWVGFAYADRTSGQTTRDRFGYLKTYHHTSAVLKDATTLGTVVSEYPIGVQGYTASSAQAGQYQSFNVAGYFEATASTHYLGLAMRTSTATDVTFTVAGDATNKLILIYHEIKGDVIT
jgi:hypothetical protein